MGLPGQVLVEFLGGGSIYSKLVMGWAGMGLFFVGLVHLGSLCRRGLAMLLYGLFYFGGWAQASCGMVMLCY